jgi:hypothetical protein
MELPTTDQNNIEEEPPNPMEPMKQVAHSLFAVVPCGQSGTIVEIPEPERGLHDQQNNMDRASSDSCETASHSQNVKFESPSDDETESVCSVGNREQMLDKPTDKGAEKQEFPDACAESINEKPHININNKPFQNTELLRSHLQ